MGLKSFGPTIDCSEMKENFWPLKQWPEILFHFRIVHMIKPFDKLNSRGGKVQREWVKNLKILMEFIRNLRVRSHVFLVDTYHEIKKDRSEVAKCTDTGNGHPRLQQPAFSRPCSND